ncbi:MAG: 3-hydroxybutyryl-CoA dehydrogenase [Actinomycetota bacterium]
MFTPESLIATTKEMGAGMTDDYAASAAGLQRIGVVGCGQMGAGIVEVCARAGLDVVVREVGPDALAAGRRRIESSMDKAVARGKLAASARAEHLERIRFTTELGDMGDRELVIEAVVERVDLKAAVLGLHFFNPVPVMRLVELVTSLMTAPATTAMATVFVENTLNKVLVRSKDRAGFIVNALLIPYILSSIRMLESGFATPEDIDAGMVEGCAHPMGPLALADLIGLDTVAAVADALYEEFKEPPYATPPLLTRMNEAGLLGRKRGRGFYEYPPR